MLKNKIHVPNEMVDKVAQLVVMFYDSFYQINDTFKRIEQLKGDVSSIVNNEDYDPPLICTFLLQILFEGEDNRKEQMAEFMDDVFQLGLKGGLQPYEAMFNVVNMFKIVWEENNTPRLQMKSDEDISILVYNAPAGYDVEELPSETQLSNQP